MKKEEQLLARKLRLHGLSMHEIRDKLGVAKSSVSLWVRDIILPDKYLKELSRKGQTKGVIERRRQTRLVRENARRQIIIDAAKREVTEISDETLKFLGVMLYWAEGGKTQHSLVRFSNSDPEMIKLEMKFFRKICKVSELKFRGHIHIHPHLDYQKAERYWSEIIGIPLGQFYKTYRKMSIASKQKRDTLPYGTLDIYIGSTELFLKIKGWTEGICEKVP